MIPQEKAELADLLDEKMFRCKPGFKFELVSKITNGGEHEIFLVKLNLRPARTGKQR